MKNIVLACLFILVNTGLSAQKVASWEFKISNPQAKEGETAELVFIARIDKNWQVYSSDFWADMGPQPTEFLFEENDSFERIGKIEPVSPKKKTDDTWGNEITYFDEKAEFRQRIKVLKNNFSIKGKIKGQVCNAKNGVCELFETNFAF